MVNKKMNNKIWVEIFGIWSLYRWADETPNDTLRIPKHLFKKIEVI